MSDLVGNPEDRFSHVMAPLVLTCGSHPSNQKDKNIENFKKELHILGHNIEPVSNEIFCLY